MADYQPNWRDKIAAGICNFVLRRIATKRYGDFIGASIEYGMRAAARDEAEGRESPPDWRTRG